MRLEVHDAAPAPSRPRAAPAQDAESGRGLLIVDEVATASGVQDIGGDGKVAWAEFTADEAPVPDGAEAARAPRA